MPIGARPREHIKSIDGNDFVRFSDALQRTAATNRYNRRHERVPGQRSPPDADGLRRIRCPDHLAGAAKSSPWIASGTEPPPWALMLIGTGAAEPGLISKRTGVHARAWIGTHAEKPLGVLPLPVRILEDDVVANSVGDRVPGNRQPGPGKAGLDVLRTASAVAFLAYCGALDSMGAVVVPASHPIATSSASSEDTRVMPRFLMVLLPSTIRSGVPAVAFFGSPAVSVETRGFADRPRGRGALVGRSGSNTGTSCRAALSGERRRATSR